MREQKKKLEHNELMRSLASATNANILNWTIRAIKEHNYEVRRKKTAVHLTREQQRYINGMFLNIYLIAAQLESGAISKEEWMNELMTI